MSNPPALCTEMRLHVGDDGTPLVNSRDVAELFGKRHDHVMQSIGALLEPTQDFGASNKSMGYDVARHGMSPDDNGRQCPPDIAGRNWFRKSFYLGGNGEDRPCYELTRDGLTLLVMGYTGAKAMQFKVRYIEAFNEMERSLKATSSDDRFLAAVREIVAPLAVRFDGQDRAIERVETRLSAITEDVAHIKMRLDDRRRNLTETTKREHIEDVAMMGGKCPCCRVAEVVIESGRAAFAEFDHFYTNSKPDGAHTWLICKPCHTEMTTGRVARSDREADFRSYQSARRRLPGRQPNLFG